MWYHQLQTLSTAKKSVSRLFFWYQFIQFETIKRSNLLCKLNPTQCHFCQFFGCHLKNHDNVKLFKLLQKLLGENQQLKPDEKGPSLWATPPALKAPQLLGSSRLIFLVGGKLDNASLPSLWHPYPHSIMIVIVTIIRTNIIIAIIQSQLHNTDPCLWQGHALFAHVLQTWSNTHFF